MSGPGAAAQRWAERLGFMVRFGMLCRGCGERVALSEWVMLENPAGLMCPYCYTVRGTV